MPSGYRGEREQDHAALEGMVFYAQTGQCRWQVLLSHLQNRQDAQACGTCDNCIRIAEARAGLQTELMQRAAETVQALAGLPAFKPDDAVKVRRYGKGRVVAADASTVTVAFDDGPQRVFHPDYVSPVATRRKRSAAVSSIG